MLQLQHLSSGTSGDLALSLAVGSVLQSSRGDVDAALFRYRLADTRDSASVWNNVALCLHQRNKVVGAISCLKRAYYLNPLGV